MADEGKVVEVDFDGDPPAQVVVPLEVTTETVRRAQDSLHYAEQRALSDLARAYRASHPEEQTP